MSAAIPQILRTRLTALLGCDAPVIQAGMGGVARSELAAAVCEAGGFGSLGMVRESPQLIEDEICRLRALTDRPFGVNLIPAATDPALLAAELDACLRLEVPVIMGFWTPDRAFIGRAKDAGCIVLWQAGTADEASAAARYGADAVILQGHEAGGHVRGTLSRNALLARVRSALDLPLAAAGGIGDGAAMAHAMARGAEGVVCGSLFAAASESFAHDVHKHRLVEGSGAETLLTDAFVRGWPDGARVRVLPSRVTDRLAGRLLGHRADGLPLGLVGVDGGREILSYSTHSPLRTTLGLLDEMPFYGGRGIDAIDAIRPASEILAKLVAEAAAVLAQMPPETGPLPQPGAPGFASPPCQMHEQDAAWLGFMPDGEIVDSLNELLEAERAGARVCARYAGEAHDAHAAALLRGVGRAEGHWVHMLTGHVRRLGGDPSPATGAFYGKALRREGLTARMEFLNRGQQWVADRLGVMIPQIADPALRRDLEDMRDAHLENIDACADAAGPAEGAAD